MTVSVDKSVAIDPRRYDAVLFDLDGVTTDTAVVHGAAWRRLFDTALANRPEHPGENHAPFTDDDYRNHIDGKPRLDGVRDFLATRGVVLPEGEPDDDGESTVHGLANRKQQLFLDALRDGVRAFDSTVRLVTELQRAGVGTALYSASRNCREVLAAAGLEQLFAVVVDGRTAIEMGLPGKPDPAMPAEAARRLGALPTRCVIVEDAVAGVQAGRRGGFALVIGVDRTGSGAALREHGADVVVTDLRQVRIRSCFADEAADGQDSADSLVFDGYDPQAERLREALCTVGNGNFATRGCAPESRAGELHYPGTYCAGVFNRLTDTVAGRVIDNESMVNLPNWLPLTYRVDGGPWFDIDTAEILSYRQTLDLRCAELVREFRVRDEQGRITAVTQRRFASMDAPQVAALQMQLVAENYDGTIEFRSSIDGGVRNSGVSRYHGLADVHLTDMRRHKIGPDAVLIETTTSQSRIPVAVGARTTVWSGTEPATEPAIAKRRYLQSEGQVGQDISTRVECGQPIIVEKVAMVVHGRDNAVSEPGVHVHRHLGSLERYQDLRRAHSQAWSGLWNQLDIDLDGNIEELRVLRLHLLHLIQTLSPHSADLDVGVPARGLHGEAYRGHIFWDELYILPVLNLRFPAISRSVLAYRFRRLPAARQAAAAAGYRGAMFPWQSGSDGREESQQLHLNPLSGRWNPDASARAHHVGLAVAYNVWHYFQTTADTEFLVEFGAELIVDIARFWVSLAQYHPDRDRYEIRGVIGPDEYQSGYPDRPHDGIDNNAYTNVMAAWVITRALDTLELLPLPDRLALLAKLGITNAELERFDRVSRRLLVPFHDGVISQFQGYEDLAELDWEGYRKHYGDIARLDRILEAEHDDVNRYRAGKQADVLMLFYLLSADELQAVFERLGYPLTPQLLPDTVDYYLQRTSHGSTLSAVVHSWVLARTHRDRAMTFFHEVLRSDIDDIQGGTTAEGIHLAAMAGSIDLVQRCFTGLEVGSGILQLNPRWPESLNALVFSIRYRGHRLFIWVSGDSVEVAAGSGTAAPITVQCHGRRATLAAGGSVRFD